MTSVNAGGGAGDNSKIGAGSGEKVNDAQSTKGSETPKKTSEWQGREVSEEAKENHQEVIGLSRRLYKAKTEEPAVWVKGNVSVNNERNPRVNIGLIGEPEFSILKSDKDIDKEERKQFKESFIKNHVHQNMTKEDAKRFVKDHQLTGKKSQIFYQSEGSNQIMLTTRYLKTLDAKNMYHHETFEFRNDNEFYRIDPDVPQEAEKIDLPKYLEANKDKIIGVSQNKSTFNIKTK